MSASCDHDHHRRGLAGAALGQALERAAARMEGRGERMTAPRRRVLGLLLEAGEPVKAYDLIARFGDDGQAAKPPTVYRALEFLEKQGLAHRIASLSAYVACNDAGRDHAAAFLICDCCGASEEAQAALDGVVAEAAGRAGYVVHGVTLEAHGLCRDCRED